MLRRFLFIAAALAFAPFLRAGEEAPKNPFAGKWQPAPVGGSFRMDDSIIWCGSVIKHDDGRYYMFASRWPKKLGMGAWVTNSEVVLASSDKLGGPYQFEQSVLPPRGPEFWDGSATHNPTIHRHGKQYVLFYTGIRYDFPKPADKAPERKLYEEAWNTKRIGVATATSPKGPWKRLDHPILETRPDQWDAAITSNPAAVIHEDGSVLLLYKSAPVPYPERNRNGRLSFGLARAKSIEGPYERLNLDKPLLIGGKNASVEDPFIWQAGGKYHMIAKSMDSQLVGAYNGFYAWSKDGLDWKLADPPQAYDMNLAWSDGQTVKMKKRERPQVFLENCKPKMVFFATTMPDGSIFNTGVPLAPEEVSIRIEDNGQIFFNDDPVDSPEVSDLKDLKLRLHKLHDDQKASKTEEPVILSAGKQVRYKRVEDVIDVLQKAGITNVTFQIGKPD